MIEYVKLFYTWSDTKKQVVDVKILNNIINTHTMKLSVYKNTGKY